MTNTANTIKPFFAEKSARLSNELATYIPGGVDSPFRSFKEVGGHTLFFKYARGSKIYDIDDNEFIDYLGAWGPAILGHCMPQVVQACQSAITLGPVFGTPHELELELAKLVCQSVPSVEMVRFVNSGTEAVMSALRLARGYTGRNFIIMFEGGYHGHSDSVLASTGHSSSTGIPHSLSDHTLLVPFNDIKALESCLLEYKGSVAAVITEPIPASMGIIPPEPNYLEKMRKLCDASDTLLIFDEVLTGCRLAKGGAQELFGISADLTCFGKALAGGMPIGAYGGRRDIMLNLEPVGKVYQAGTFSGNPVTMAGGIATLTMLQDKKIYEALESRSAQLFDGLSQVITKKSLPVQLQRAGSMFSILFSPIPVKNFKDSLKIDAAMFASFFHELLRKGIYFPPSAVDCAVISAAHTSLDIDYTISAIADILTELY